MCIRSGIVKPLLERRYLEPYKINYLLSTRKKYEIVNPTLSKVVSSMGKLYSLRVAIVCWKENHLAKAVIMCV